MVRWDSLPVHPTRVRERFDRPLLVALLGVTALALLLRLVLLGDRVAHFDEGRVAYDALRYLKTGAWKYDPTRHGPFLAQVNKRVFALLGPSDFSARLVVALLGGLLPLSAWLFRERLADAELLALAAIFAIDPILLYYSRFMRNDVVVATFSIVGLGLLVRLLDTGRTRYLYAGTGTFALAFTAKENAIVYPVTILGALVLLFDHRLFLARHRGEDWTVVGRDRIRRAARGIWRYKFAILVGALEFVAIFAFFYAPRLGPVGGPGLWEAIANPSLLPGVLDAATFGTVEKIERTWIGGPFQKHGYVPYLGYLVYRLGKASGAIVLLALLGFVVDRYGVERPTDLVALGFYGGAASVVGYPLAMSVPAAWTATHVLVFLAFPAAAGVAFLFRSVRTGLPEPGLDLGTLALVVLLASGAYTTGMAIQTSYVAPQRNVLVQYSQPAGDMRPAIEAAQNASAANAGVDVRWYGEAFLVENESDAYLLGVRDGQWYARLPLPWYFEIANATVDSVPGDGVGSTLGTDPPPVVVTCADWSKCPGEAERDRLAAQLSDYVAFPPYEARYNPDGPVYSYVFFVHERYVAGANSPA